MSESMKKLASSYVSDEDSQYAAFSRVVRTPEGARHYGVPIGTVIGLKGVNQEVKPGDALTPVDDKIKKPKAGEKYNTKLFAMRVAELRKVIQKLDTDSIRNLLKKLEDSKDFPQTRNYDKIREMLKKYLKDRLAASKDKEKVVAKS